VLVAFNFNPDIATHKNNCYMANSQILLNECPNEVVLIESTVGLYQFFVGSRNSPFPWCSKMWSSSGD